MARQAVRVHEAYGGALQERTPPGGSTRVREKQLSERASLWNTWWTKPSPRTSRPWPKTSRSKTIQIRPFARSFRQLFKVPNTEPPRHRGPAGPYISLLTRTSTIIDAMAATRNPSLTKDCTHQNPSPATSQVTESAHRHGRPSPTDLGGPTVLANRGASRSPRRSSPRSRPPRSWPGTSRSGCSSGFQRRKAMG